MKKANAKEDMGIKANMVGEHPYNPSLIEKKWQKIWDKEKTYSPNLNKAKKPYYNLMMFPYPSAEGMHVGNMYAFTGSDIWGRYQRMKGMQVFEPIGLDGFGIHSENYAIKIGAHPVTQAEVTKKRFYEQLRSTGNGFDWDHTLETYDPLYYRWTQWVFIQMFKHGLAYRKKAQVNWCPSCLTVLADEQVIGGECERCKSIVEARNLVQWFFKITDYAEKLLGNLEKIDWAEKVKIAQKNWIGKKEGIEIEYKVDMGSRGDKGKTIKVFTTRPDTNFGATFIVVAPEHALALEITTDENRKNVEKYIKIAKSKSSQDRIAEGREKTGVFTGSYALNNLTGEKMPVWISDFVLADFGTGAVVGVPGHDLRDFQFAQKFDLPIKRVVVGMDGDTSEIISESQVQEESGTMTNSEFLDGLDIHEATVKIMDYLVEKGWGKRVTTYHLRDWLISRQRYWGPPIPMIYCEKCASEGKSWFTSSEAEETLNSKLETLNKSKISNPKPLEFRNSNLEFAASRAGWYPVPEEDLPVELPYVQNYRPTGTGESPLAQSEEFVQVNCPNCGAQARRETDVSDTFLDSAWYFLRYPSITENSKFEILNSKINDKWKMTNDKLPWNQEITKSWLPVDMYIGGPEHAVLHLLYSRFVTMAFADWGLLEFEEPFSRFYAHGMIIKDGAKMSKSKGNVVVPDTYIQKYGADTLRTYLMFLGPFDQDGDFRDTGIEGMYRFVKRVWKLVDMNKGNVGNKENMGEEKLRNQAIKRVTEDLDNLRYNRAIAGIMEYVNGLEEIDKDKGISKEAIKTLMLLFAPFAPHMTEEIYQNLFRNSKSETRNSKERFESIHHHPWPQYDPTILEEDTVQIPVQVNGKHRGTITVDSDRASDRQEIEKLARENVAKYLTHEPKKVVFVPSKLINFVI